MNYLLEIGCEEIPAFYLNPALKSWQLIFEEMLRERNLQFNTTQTVGTPRRMMIFISELPEKQDDLDEFVIGPPKDKAFNDDGTPTKALEGFCKKNSISVDDVVDYEEVKKNKKILRVAATAKHQGKKTVEILRDIVPQTLKKIKFPKNMRWGRTFADGTIFEFARPVRYFLSLLDDKVLEFDSAGIPVGNKTQTHRFINRDTDSIEIKSADLEEYELELAQNDVVIDTDERIKLIQDEINELCKQVGLKVDKDVKDSLMPEVANLVEFPHVIVGEFEKEYLEIPSEILKSAMIKHQRYFPLEDSAGNLQNKFLVVTNRADDDEGVIKAGNERVLRARLHDARFFWQNDVRTGIEEYAKKLDEVSFHQDLGSMKEKVERLSKLAVKIAKELNIDTEMAEKAAQLCKADLVSETVYEFAELQGNIGGLLAKQADLSDEISQAIYEHYLPSGSDNKSSSTTTVLHRIFRSTCKIDPDITQSLIGKAISLADKIDSLAGYFLCELDKKKGGDPLGLRRLTLGIIYVARKLPNFNIVKHMKNSLEQYSTIKRKKKEHIVTDVDRNDSLERLCSFLKTRLTVNLIEYGYHHDDVDSVLSSGFDDLNLIDTKLRALINVMERGNWVELVRLVERTANITKNTPEITNFDEKLLQDDAEKSLGKVFMKNHQKIEKLFKAQKFVEGAQLFYDVFAESTEKFFADVFVNVDDEKIRNNRLGLIRSIYNLFADNFARLEHIVISGNDDKISDDC